MKCHYSYDPEVGRFLMPGCIAVAHTWDMDRCTCRGYEEAFERAEYNKTLAEKNREIKQLEKEVARLERLVGKLTRKS